MCGINGFNFLDKKTLQKMNDSLKHRGPDDSGIFTENKNKVSLGHTRLSIIDLSDAGHQPMFYSKELGACSKKHNKKNLKKSKIGIIFNGEIYNFRELKKSLQEKGYKFSTKTDTEVILTSYLEWGENCVKKFHGMWAFCIYDLKEKILFLSRDRIGIKPLYYYHNSKTGKFIFSSEIKAILQHNIKRNPNEKAIFDFLYYNFRDHEKNTFFKNIERIMPGENLILNLKKKTISKKKYYDLKKESGKNFKGNFLMFLEKSIKKRLISDVEVRATLSGGLDSSSIVCLMKKLDSGKKLKTFSLIFPGENIDESNFQEIVQKKTSSKRNTTTFNEDDIIKDIEDFIYLHEEPLKSFSQYGQYKVMELAKNHKTKVLLDGQGADEILAGYDWFYGHWILELFLKLRLVKMVKEIIYFKKRRKNLDIIKYFLIALIPRKIVKILWKKRMDHINYKSFKKIKSKSPKDRQWNCRTLNQLSYIAETYSTLPELLNYEDKNSMKWSIESRVPFCDHELVEFVLNQPSNKKINNGETKVILREAMKGILPEEIRKRKDKVGFATPDKEILNNPKMREHFEEMLNSKEFKEIPYFRHKNIKKRYYEHISGKKDNSRELFKIFLFYKWWGKFIEK